METTPQTSDHAAGRVISRSEYEAKRLHGYAGIAVEDEAAALWRECSPWWDGKYWLMFPSRAGVALGPVNVR